MCHLWNLVVENPVVYPFEFKNQVDTPWAVVMASCSTYKTGAAPLRATPVDQNYSDTKMIIYSNTQTPVPV